MGNRGVYTLQELRKARTREVFEAAGSIILDAGVFAVGGVSAALIASYGIPAIGAAVVTFVEWLGFSGVPTVPLVAAGITTAVGGSTSLPLVAASITTTIGGSAATLAVAKVFDSLNPFEQARQAKA